MTRHAERQGGAGAIRVGSGGVKASLVRPDEMDGGPNWRHSVTIPRQLNRRCNCTPQVVSPRNSDDCRMEEKGCRWKDVGRLLLRHGHGI